MVSVRLTAYKKELEPGCSLANALGWSLGADVEWVDVWRGAVKDRFQRQFWIGEPNCNETGLLTEGDAAEGICQAEGFGATERAHSQNHLWRNARVMVGDISQLFEEF